MKDKTLSIRLSEADLEILTEAANAKNLSPSTFARSLLLTALKNNLEVVPHSASLTPELDKLDPKVRFALFRPLEIVVKDLSSNNVPTLEIEKLLLFSAATEESKFIHLHASQAKLTKKCNL